MKKALIYGFNRYDSQPSLRGCVNDAIDFYDVATNILGYDAHLVSDLPTDCDTFTASVGALLTPEPGEVAGSRILYFAGHGYRAYDKPPLDEDDGIDELLCLPSYQAGNAQSFVLDDHIGVLLSQATLTDPNMRVYVILDSCHSGTAIRNVDGGWKFIGPNLLAQFSIEHVEELPLSIDDPRIALALVDREASESVFKAAQAEVMSPEYGLKDGGLLGVIRQSTAPHLLLSGCGKNETCKETVVAGTYRGLFTKLLCQHIRQSPGQSWTELHAALTSTIPTHFNQRPQLEGTDEIKASSIFS